MIITLTIEMSLRKAQRYFKEFDASKNYRKVRNTETQKNTFADAKETREAEATLL